MTDTREKLEADIRKLYSYSTSTLIYPTSPKKTTDYIKSVSVDTVLGWLDRQAAITEWECRERAEKVECDCDCCRWQDERDELQAQLDNSMPLPLDADGVPIRVGDTVEYSDGYEMWTMRVGMIGRECVEECESGVVAKICHHVKRDPLVGLAIDLMRDGFLADVPRSEWDVRATEVARLIREALKVVGDD